MALDYVRALREETATGGEVLRPAVKMSAEEMAHREATARATEHENGRYGRFRDQQGNWAWAWQAHGRTTPLIPPRFVEPAGKIRRLPTGELVLEGGGREQPALIEPQSWVVVYEGQPDEAIVATDGEFRNVMTPENRVQSPVDAPSPAEAVDDRPAPETAPRPAPGPANMVPSVSIDGFVAQVLIDNARLRTEFAVAAGQRDDAWRAQRDNAAASTSWQSESAHWRTVADQRQGRINWLLTQIAKAIRQEPNDLSISWPEDYEIEAFLADAGRMYREDIERVNAAAKEAGDEQPVNHVTDLPPEASAPVQLPRKSDAELIAHAANADEFHRSKRAPLHKPKS